jgi:1,4-alpha-glucan branching enzyme
MMGWMHDLLEYKKLDPLFRKDHHHELTFSLVYAFSEKFMLPLSHDEVVHGKGTLLTRMPGNEEQKFSGLRLLFGYMWTHPGTQLLFMGGEFGQTSEWSIERGLEWWLTQYDFHKGVQNWVKDLNHFYKNTPAMFEKQFEADGFEWIEHADYLNSVLTFIRRGKNKKDVIIVVCNFTPVARPNYCFGVPFSGSYELVLNSDEKKYAGNGTDCTKTVKAKKEEKHNRDYSVEVTLPPLAMIVYKPVAIKKLAATKAKKAVK